MQNEIRPIRPIENDDDYMQALAEINRLAYAPRGSLREARRKALSALVEGYWENHHKFD